MHLFFTAQALLSTTNPIYLILCINLLIRDKEFDPGAFGCFDLAALVQSHLAFSVCLLVYSPAIPHEYATVEDCRSVIDQVQWDTTSTEISPESRQNRQQGGIKDDHIILLRQDLTVGAT